MVMTLEAVRAALENGNTSSVALVRNCLERIAAGPEGGRAFVHVFAEAAVAEAEAVDRRRAAGICTGALGGIPVSIKDLFDVRGIATTAGSKVLAGAPAAVRDAVVVARLRAAGAVVVGRTNMTEFAFSGLGINPHYGTPANPFDRESRRLPGGSSSGAAVSVSDGMALAAIGTDTGGSVRIPAALCGLVGFKPTAARVPLAGTLPLSPSLDSIGPIARSVRCCRIVDEVLSGSPHDAAPPADVRHLRIGIPVSPALDDLDPAVAVAFEAAVARLAAQGAQIISRDVPEFAAAGETASVATFPAAEAYAWHRDLLARNEAGYDPRVCVRILRGQSIGAADYLWLLRRRSELIAAVRSRLAGLDAVVLPTVPITAPPIDSVAGDDDAYHRINLLLLRNPTYINFLDGCAISIPCHAAGGAPVGLMLARFDGDDGALLGIGEAVERALAGD